MEHDPTQRDASTTPTSEMRAIMAAMVPAPGQDVAALRRHARTSKSRWNADECAGLEVHRGTIPGADGARPLLVLRAAGAAGAPILHIHGGGWAICDLETHLALLAQLARVSGRPVMAPHPRQAPEDPAPAPLDDVMAALRHIAADAEGGFFLSGDSAGANLGLAALLRARDEGAPLPVRAVSLQYGCFLNRFDAESHRLFGDGRFGLSSDRMRLFWSMYAPQGAPYTDLSEYDLAGMPPVQVHVAALDPLRDDSEWLRARLVACGNPPDWHMWDGVIHGFLHYHRELAPAREALQATADFFDLHCEA
jgi:acetyl esterase